MSGSLNLIYDSIISKKRDDLIYWIPKVWITNDKVEVLEEKDDMVRVEPYQFINAQISGIVEKAEHGKSYHNSLSKVFDLPTENGKIIDGDSKRLPGDWLVGANIYGLYPRNFTSFDHDQDGELGGDSKNVTLNSQGIKETGTFLKAIALLPYIKSLGFNTIYLLPVSLIGVANKKGDLGCPYGLRNPFKLDLVYHDTLVDEFDVGVQFKAYVEAAHILGIRVILDFVPRTAARDSEFIKEHPDWFYWIKKSEDANYHSPAFSAEELQEIHHSVANIHDTKEKIMVPPHKDYIDIFTEPPVPENIEYLGNDDGYVGKVDGEEVVVPGAFADWPPDDIQPPWTDVTYFKLYKDSDFNYVAYNTVRMYDGRINEINQPLWDTVSNFIPYFQEEFGIDGARIDMGHALPHDLEHIIIEKARANDIDFGFLSEDFNPWAKARAKGYNMVMSNMWYTLPRTGVAGDNGDSIAKNFIKSLPNYPNPVLGAAATADTPRAASRKGGVKFSKAAWMLINTMPNVVPFIMAGFELGETKPTNLGLDFTPEEIKVMSKESLGFFDRDVLKWLSPYRKEMTEIVKTMNQFREENKGNLLHLDNFSWVETEVEGHYSMTPENPVIAYLRIFHNEIISVLTDSIFGETLYPIDVENDYLIVANMGCENEVIVTLTLGNDLTFYDVLSEAEYKTVDGKLNLQLKPGETIIAVSA